MCIVFWSDTPIYSLVVASNRDEFLARPTTDAAWHSWDPRALADEPDERRRTLSGLDLNAGGTWFGISLAPEDGPGTGHGRRMHFATLTNFTEEIPPGTRPSRGQLTRDFLDRISSSSASESTLEDYLAIVEKQKQDYAGFNLVVGEISRPPPADSASRETQVHLAYISNRENPRKRARVLPPLPHAGAGVVAGSDGSKRVRAVSNATLEVEDGEEEWPKVKGGAAALEQVLQDVERDGLSKEEQEKELVEGMYRVLSTAHPSPILHRTHLRHTVLVRPLALDPSAPLPAIPPPFPSTSPSPSPLSPDSTKREGEDGVHWYATRVQTLLLVERETGRVVVREREAYVLDEEGRPKWSGKERAFEFVL
ncbi:Transport and Golgi organization protein 2 [Rhodotorula toruloides]|nr:Transport and Golgi organization protein 2 [Rhodotorula toruloides]